MCPLSRSCRICHSGSVPSPPLEAPEPSSCLFQLFRAPGVAQLVAAFSSHSLIFLLSCLRLKPPSDTNLFLNPDSSSIRSFTKGGPWSGPGHVCYGNQCLDPFIVHLTGPREHSRIMAQLTVGAREVVLWVEYFPDTQNWVLCCVLTL